MSYRIFIVNLYETEGDQPQGYFTSRENAHRHLAYLVEHGNYPEEELSVSEAVVHSSGKHEEVYGDLGIGPQAYRKDSLVSFPTKNDPAEARPFSTRKGD